MENSLVDNKFSLTSGYIYIYIQPGVINCFKAEKVKKFFPFKDTANLFSRKRNFFKPPGKSYRVEQ